jgi:hypothetical protein
VIVLFSLGKFARAMSYFAVAVAFVFFTRILFGVKLYDRPEKTNRLRIGLSSAQQKSRYKEIRMGHS